MPKISAGHGWSWKFFFADFQILGPLGCQGWVVIPQMWKKSKSLHRTVQSYKTCFHTNNSICLAYFINKLYVSATDREDLRHDGHSGKTADDPTERLVQWWWTFLKKYLYKIWKFDTYIFMIFLLVWYDCQQMVNGSDETLHAVYFWLVRLISFIYILFFR